MVHKTLLAAAISLAVASPFALAGEQSETFGEAKSYSEYRVSDSHYSLRASDVIGMEIKNAEDDTIGEIDDLIIGRSDNVVRAIVSVGGFLGIGDKLVAVPYDQLKVTPDGDNIFFDKTEDELKAMQAFAYSDNEGLGAEIWEERLALRNNGDESAEMAAMEADDDMDVNWNKVEGNWKKFKGHAQKQWGKLTNDDLDVVEGNRKILAGKLQARYGISEAEADTQIDGWVKQL